MRNRRRIRSAGFPLYVEAIFVADVPSCLTALADRIVPVAAGTIDQLAALPGYDAGAAGRHAAEARIGEVLAGLTPDGKADRIRAVQTGGLPAGVALPGVSDGGVLSGGLTRRPVRMSYS